jgi:hypothetical protein
MEVAVQGSRQNIDIEFHPFDLIEQFHYFLRFSSASAYITSMLISSGWPPNLSYLMSNMLSK